MLISKILIRLLLFFLCLIILIFLLIFINTPSMMNSQGTELMCENTLKMMSIAVKEYQVDWNGQWPPSLMALGPYYKGKYKPGPNSIPKCPGGRDENQETGSSSEYYYYPSKVKGIVPVCWDSKPHHTTLFLFPDSFLWIVLYSDGHVERLSKEKLIQDLSQLAETNPDILKVLNLLNVEKDNN